MIGIKRTKDDEECEWCGSTEDCECEPCPFCEGTGCV